MAERFTDRVAVVTGASSGIGHAIAERLAAEEAGIEGLAKHLAGRGGEHGVRVNVVRPGRILTDKWEGVLGRDGLFWSHYEKTQLLKRHGRTQDVAAVVKL
jgi:NAD(P)-dependent dehydrogenase (short-subunit alcohol dehydrogenase family)